VPLDKKAESLAAAGPSSGMGIPYVEKEKSAHGRDMKGKSQKECRMPA